MKLDRREFVTMVGATVTSSAAARFSAAATEGAGGVLEKNGWRLQVSPTGEIVSFTNGKLELINRRQGDNRPYVDVGRWGKTRYSCERPSASGQEGSRLWFKYDFSGADKFSIVYELELLELDARAERRSARVAGATRPGDPYIVALKQKVGIQAASKLDTVVKLVLPRNLQLPFENREVFLPLKNGIGRRKTIEGMESEDEYAFSLAGDYAAMGKPQLLAIPMVDEYAGQTDLRLTHGADPYFSSYFFLAHGEKIGRFNCRYPGEVGVEKEERVVYTGLHRGDEKTAMQVFYASSLADVRPGPDWLHDVAMVDFDYLSKNGQGWFRDIDALAARIAPEDRSKIFLALHGWYDYVGRYAFNWRQGAFDKNWTAFPSALEPRVQAFADYPANEAGFGWPRASVKAMRPVPMSLADMHRRIRYAKERGFRVGIYYADGTNACDSMKETYDPSKVLHWGGWEGPDTTGKVYAQNPLHPEVREFYLRYIHALLEEYGKEVDGFIWDETYVVHNEVGPVPPGTGLGPAPPGAAVGARRRLAPTPNPAKLGYPSRGMMTLMKEVAAAVARYNPELAFLASDVIGAWYVYEQAVPYCLVAHGTYQDSACTPAAWSYGLFPNYRNVLWSCNWAPVRRFELTRYAVETFQAPVAISNGAFGEDIGFGDMDAALQQKFLDLFNKRKRERMEISWITEEPWQPRYQGREVRFKWDL